MSAAIIFMFHLILQRRALVLLFSAVFSHGFIAAASSVGDRCTNDNPCAPSEDESLFCDYTIGPVPGGYCQACGGSDVDYCYSEEITTDEGIDDCISKCTSIHCTEPCGEGEFCTYFDYGAEGPCQSCDVLIVHPDECLAQGWEAKGEEECLATCSPKTCTKDYDCIAYASYDLGTNYFCNFSGFRPNGTCEACSGLASIDECSERADMELGVQSCRNMCAESVASPCESNNDCMKDRSYCNDEIGVCEDCPSLNFVDWHVDDCFNETFLGLSSSSSENCASACHTECWDEMDGVISMRGGFTLAGKEEILPQQGSAHTSVSGTLVDCQLGGRNECDPNAPESFVCLISRGVYYLAEKVMNCVDSGGIAAIIYDNVDNGTVFDLLAFVPIDIPITGITMDDGLYLLENELGNEAEVRVQKTGDSCEVGCSDRIPCSSGAKASYCDYSYDEIGFCQKCVADADEQRLECFLSGKSLAGAIDCANICGSTFTSPSCKVCGKAVSTESLRSATDGEEKCDFCPNGLQEQYREREIPFIGKGATCWQLYQFFENYELAESNPTCQLALGFNYLCGCEGPGYAGANSEQKQNALVWVPRVSAIISFLGSSIIIIDVLRDKKRRSKMYNQLVLTLSVFDLMGSVAYSLTSLPIPKEYYVQGAKGNAATCTAQGFFIQIGTISGFVNVSLAIYYFLTIKSGWSERKIKNIRIWLFVCPIVVGLVFAFAGIPFYDMLFLWCNNSSSWWPELPIIVAILTCTFIMSSLCWFVYKTEKSTRKYGRQQGNSMASLVFWQSLWYLLAFYLTWPPYLALQFLWASGNSYTSYGFILFATALVPLQGFWNCVVYFRQRASKELRRRFSVITSALSNATSSLQKSTWKIGKSSKPSEDTTTNTAQRSNLTKTSTEASSGVEHSRQLPAV